MPYTLPDVSCSENYVTVLSIPDDTPAVMHLPRSDFHNLARPVPSNESNASSSTHSSHTTCSGYTASDNMCASGRKGVKMGMVSTMNDYNKRGHTRIPKSQSESSALGAHNNMRRDLAHKSGFFYGLDDKYEEGLSKVPDEAANLGVKAQKIVFGADGIGLRTGLVVTGVPQPTNPDKLIAVEVIDVEADSRAAKDDQLRVGDRIMKINGRPVYQMSLPRARAYLHELETQPEPFLTFYRMPQFSPTEKDCPYQYKQVTIPQQQGNTRKVHEVTVKTLIKGEKGFGFGLASRRSPTDKSNIFLVTTIVPGGPTDGVLQPGDRILAINGEDLADRTQSEIVRLMRNTTVGAELSFQISRKPSSSETDAKSESLLSLHTVHIPGLDDAMKILRLKVAVNEKVGAGLGLNLKAKQTHKENDELVDGGIYVGRILHGSAAFKDGQIREGDRILGIENVNLLSFKRNADAVHVFNQTVAEMPANSQFFRLIVGRVTNVLDERNETMSWADFVQWALEVEQDIQTHTQWSGSVTSSVDERKDDELESQTSALPEEPFTRDAASRKSFSEKAPFGMKDVGQLENMRKIVHQRHISAPQVKNVPPRTTTVSLGLTTPVKTTVTSLKRGGSTISRQRRKQIQLEYAGHVKLTAQPETRTAPSSPDSACRRKSVVSAASTGFWKGLFGGKSPILGRKKNGKLEQSGTVEQRQRRSVSEKHLFVAEELTVEKDDICQQEVPNKEVAEIKSPIVSIRCNEPNADDENAVKDFYQTSVAVNGSPKSDKENNQCPAGTLRRSVNEEETDTADRLRSRSHHEELAESSQRSLQSVFKFLSGRGAEPVQSVDEIAPRKVLLDQNNTNNTLPGQSSFKLQAAGHHQRFNSVQGSLPTETSSQQPFFRYHPQRLSLGPEAAPCIRPATMPCSHIGFMVQPGLNTHRPGAKPHIQSNSAGLWPQPLLSSRSSYATNTQRYWQFEPQRRCAYFTRHPVYESSVAKSPEQLSAREPPVYSALYPERTAADADYYNSFNQYFSHASRPDDYDYEPRNEHSYQTEAPTYEPQAERRKLKAGYNENLRVDGPQYHYFTETAELDDTKLPRTRTVTQPRSTSVPRRRPQSHIVHPASRFICASQDINLPSAFFQQYRTHQFPTNNSGQHHSFSTTPFDAYVERF